MAVRHVMSVVVDRPAAQVWEFMTDPFNVPRLGGQTLSARWTSPGQTDVGATMQARMSILGFETRMDAVVTEWQPPRLIEFSAKVRPIKEAATVRTILDPDGDGTRVTREIEFELRPIYRLIWPVIGRLVRRRWNVSTHNLKGLVEAAYPGPKC